MKYIYLANIEGTDIYKIGFTKIDPNKRLESLQTGNPFKLVLTDSYQSKIAPQIESIMHRFMHHKKYVSESDYTLLGEWFKLTMEDVKEFKTKCSKIESNLKVIAENSTLFK